MSPGGPGAKFTFSECYLVVCTSDVYLAEMSQLTRNIVQFPLFVA